MTTNVAVVIPCRNEAATIRQLLDAVAAQTRTPDDVVIVDDGSTDGTPLVIEDWRRAHPNISIRVVQGPSRGVAAAVNAGIAACSVDVIVRLDGHSIPSPNYIAASLSALSQSGVGVAGGLWQIEPGAATVVARAIAKVVSHRLGSGGALYRDASGGTERAVPVDTVPFGAFRRELWQQLGGFDETLSANEDYDFNYRARRASLKIVLDPRIQSAYFARPTLAALGRQYHRYGFWKLQMLRKDARALHWRQVPPALILPWVLATSVLACVWPGPVVLGAAGAYPAIVVVGAAHVAASLTSFTAWPAAAAAIVVSHLTWSAGFLRAALGITPPSSPSR